MRVNKYYWIDSQYRRIYTKYAVPSTVIKETHA
jgi:hypothetical protein